MGGNGDENEFEGHNYLPPLIVSLLQFWPVVERKTPLLPVFGVHVGGCSCGELLQEAVSVNPIILFVK
jgi:hypothetical protein